MWTASAALLAMFAGSVLAATNTDWCDGAKMALLGEYARCHLDLTAKQLCS